MTLNNGQVKCSNWWRGTVWCLLGLVHIWTVGLYSWGIRWTVLFSSLDSQCHIVFKKCFDKIVEWCDSLFRWLDALFSSFIPFWFILLLNMWFSFSLMCTSQRKTTKCNQIQIIIVLCAVCSPWIMVTITITKSDFFSLFVIFNSV